MMRLHVIAIGFGLAMAGAAPAIAQNQPSTPATVGGGEPGRAHSLELSIGGELLTSQTLGTSTATMTTNNPSGSPYTYFTVVGTRETSPSLRAEIGYNISRTFTIEGGFVAAWGNVQGSVSGDVEGAAPLTVTERMTQYFVDVSLLAKFRQASFANGAGVPFVEGGAGYLRQMHQGNIASNSGQIYHVGGGITYMFSRRSGRLTGLGIRADARLYIPRNGYSFGTSQSVFAGVGAALLLAF